MSTTEVPGIGGEGTLKPGALKQERPRRGHKRGPFVNMVLAGGIAVATTGSAAIADKIAIDQGVELPGIHRVLEEVRDTGVKLILNKGPAAGEALDQLLGKTPEIPEGFNPQADFGIVKAGRNTTSVSEEELPSLLRNAVKPFKEGSTSVFLFFPAKLGTDERSIFHKGPESGEIFNQKTGKMELVARGLDLTFPKQNTEIIVPVPEAEVFQLPPWYVDKTPYFSGFLLRFTSPDGIIYELTIKPSRDVRELKPTPIVANAPLLGEGIRIKGGTTIAYTDFEYAQIMFRLTSSATGKKTLPLNFVTKEVNGSLKIPILK